MRGNGKDNIRLQKIAVGAGVILLTIKFIAYLVTGSNAILSDALEGIVNVAAGAVGLFSLILSATPRDLNHPYGHGKIEYISASIEGTMIIVAGIFILIKAGYAFFNPQDLQAMDLGFYLVTISGVINYILGYSMVRKGRKNHSPALEASGMHLKSDAYTTGGLIIGIALVWMTGRVWLDNSVASVFGIILIVTGVKIIRRSVGGMMDETDVKLVDAVVAALQAKRKDQWIDLHNFRIIRYGEKLHVDCHLTLPWYLTVEDAHNHTREAEKVISEALDHSVEMFVHIDPCTPGSCQSCAVEACPHRAAPFKNKVYWDRNSLFPDKKH